MDKARKDQIVTEVVKQIYDAYPTLWDKFGDNGHKRTTEDNYHHLNHLETAYYMNDQQFFMDYTKWLEQVLTTRNVGKELIIDNFERLVSQMKEDEEEKKYSSYLNNALTLLK
ncbi:hypothetical protein J5S49_12255 [Virgibacillus halodenitrificans]|uniref:hypothetical protein n=1 Tax=Virgibacillus halodenitrificans TaxID=1482 RepID=UPI001F2AD085|nr:hypothetical protein [Virgibacillus halodenitrificans]MCG1029066.1 hypothetical protein [Virgibacillus halodenitrificans]